MKPLIVNGAKTGVFFLILAYGFFKYHFLSFYSRLLEVLIETLGLDSIDILRQLNIFSKSPKWNDSLLGWLVYYPTYFLLHVIFIRLLFHHKKTVRNILILLLTTTILLLVLLAVLGKIYSLNTLYTFAYDTFNKLFSLPFILLSIEGGKILYEDIKRGIEDKK